MATKMCVWVDSELCTGCGLCLEAVPEVFAHKDGICHVKDGKKLRSGPDKLVEVPEPLHDKLIAAADECPGECIFIEVE